jgi:hypothetical protein
VLSPVELSLEVWMDVELLPTEVDTLSDDADEAELPASAGAAAKAPSNRARAVARASGDGVREV